MNVVSKQDQFYASSGAITNLKQEIGPFISLIVSTVLSRPNDNQRELVLSLVSPKLLRIPIPQNSIKLR